MDTMEMIKNARSIEIFYPEPSEVGVAGTDSNGLMFCFFDISEDELRLAKNRSLELGNDKPLDMFDYENAGIWYPVVKSKEKGKTTSITCVQDDDYAAPDGMKKHEIWMEGFAATGQSQGASKIGEGYGNSFDDAIMDYMNRNPKHGIEEDDRDGYVSDEAYKNRRSNWRIWGCRLFDNEDDARSSFG